MIRFIFACMLVVIGSFFAIGTQFMMDGIGRAHDAILARNAGQSPAPSVTARSNGPTFEEIYAMAAAHNQDDSAINSPEDLNAISTAAGGEDSFNGGFTNMAPPALMEAPAADTGTMPETN